MTRLVLFICALVIIAHIGLCCAHSSGTGSDLAWYDQQVFGTMERPTLYPGVVRTSQYLTMRDGVKIAIDLYLPWRLPGSTKISAILMQTRYVRSMRYRWPFSLFLHGRFDDLIAYFVTRGYAWVYVDARGSGASFGTRSYPYAPEEILDGAEIAEWITGQPWSNGKIGSIGNSYDGDAAIFLLAAKHGAVKAIMPRFAYFDAYPDVVRPGGLHLRWLTETWGNLGRALDADRIGDFLGWMLGFAVKGIRAVDEDTDGSLLAAAVAEHAGNGDVTAQALDVEYRDDQSGAMGIGIEQISPHTRLSAIRETRAPVYLYTGWFDAGYVLAEINLFRSLEGKPRKLTIGPWDHGGWTNISPFAKVNKPRFDHSAEAIRFFDSVLEGAESGIRREKPVTYFTMGQEEWKFADTWPPPNTKTVPFYFSPGHVLSGDPPASESDYDIYKMDYTAGTGSTSRWVSLVNPLHTPTRYPDRRSEDKKLLYYQSAPLGEALEVTGHPVVTLYVSSTANDGAFFVYLEDVDPKGRVTYITEGMLRAIHRKLSDEPPPYPTPVPFRTFLRKDAMPLEPEKTAELVFDLFPTSFLFKQGHAIRVSLAGADKDHFAFIPDEPPTIRLHRCSSAASRIDLPVVRH